MEYDYFQLKLGRERTAHKALAERLHPMAGVVAVFSPLLGFASNEALVLARAGTELGFAARQVDRLTPTLRPTQDVPPEPKGVYVHNWFTIDGQAVDEFVRLSGEAWPAFEGRFDTRIYGLFLAAETEADRAEGARRLLLMTNYRDLGEWQVSRDPTSEAMQVFLRRRELTRVSLARSCLVAPRG
ncbi:hypothetical protein [Phenylobacterium sp.]|uniref:hypothetical protein n=1 Tax=Phenylobacterium sp. TaxID=1871053 RepID=UPI002735CC05|nr:hypothetical protein [Phenylobacterium sp.]MDP3852909.1 hypothetical protein [Phenylobacterium sp.]